jgi:DNA mismatch repair protein MutL
MTGKFPTCVLMLQVPPSQVDVNIHPAKAEVRFSQEKAVMESIFFAVKNALMQNGLIYEFQMEKVSQKDWEADPAPQADYVQPTLPIQASSEIASPSSAASAVVSESSASFSSPQRAETPSPLAAVRLDTTTQIRALPEEPEQVQTAPRSEKISSDTLSGYHFLNASSFQAKAAPVPSVSEKENRGEEPLPSKKVRVLGEVFQNYILAELDGEEKLLIFDKHAAHERVIFERLQSGATKQTSQMLLKPGEIVLSMEEFTAVQENLERLESMGFSFDCSTPPTLQTLAVPSFVLELNIDEVISEIAHNLALGKADPQAHRFQDMLHSIACKSAIRSGDHTSLLELQKLAQEVWDNEAIRHCPHGRPVMFVIRKYDLEKQFRRT